MSSMEKKDWHLAVLTSDFDLTDSDPEGMLQEGVPSTL